MHQGQTREDLPTTKGESNLLRRRTTYKFLRSRIGEHREHPRRRPRVGRSPDCLRHATLNLERRRRLQRGHHSSPWGPTTVMSQSRSGRLRSGTTPQAWYCPTTSAKVIPMFRRRPSPARWDLSIFSCFALAGPSAQFLCNFAMERPVYDRSACSGVVPQIEPPLVPAAIRAG
jgi:hypothetical protein